MRITRLLWLPLVALVWAVPVHADVRGATLVVTVKDPAGHAVAGAVVEAEIGRARVVSKTDAQGIAVLASVPSGSAIVSVLAERFHAWHGRQRTDVGEVIATRVRLNPRSDEGGEAKASVGLEAFWDVRSQLRPGPSEGMGDFTSEWSLLETVEPSAITNRIAGPGLYLGEWGRYSMRGSSWTQNNVLLDGLDITDGLRGGNPLAYPDLGPIGTINITSGLAPVEYSAPGATMELTPREPSEQWHGNVEGRWVPASLQAKPRAGDVSSIARLGGLADVAGLLSGPLAGQRLRVSLSARASRMRRYERARPERLAGWTGSLFGDVLYQATDRDRLRLVTSGQALSRPFAGRPRFRDITVPERGRFFGAQVRWDHTGARHVWSTYAGLQLGWLKHPDECQCDRPIERLLDGPVPELVFPLTSRRGTWTVGSSLAWVGFRALGAWHAPRLGATIGGTMSRDVPETNHFTAELVDGTPARVWDFGYLQPDSRRHTFDVGAFAADRVAFGDRLFVDAGLRFDGSTGKARGALQGITWRTISPRVSARLRLTDAGRVSLMGGYGEYRHRLRMDALAFGDPTGAQGAVYRWRDDNGDRYYSSNERGELIAVVGPGSPDSLRSTIDPKLKPPRTREFVAGIESEPGHGWVLRLTAFDRRERDLIESIDTGAPRSAYDVSYIPDAGPSLTDPSDDRLLPVYARRSDSFGLDSYILTNPVGLKSDYQGVEARVDKSVGSRVHLLLGGTLYRARTYGGNRGFHEFEGDIGVLGELYDNPNADLYAYGRSFFDRGYAVKTSLTYRAPWDVIIGSVARYQGGQPFARYVVVRDLPQGAEPIPAVSRAVTATYRFADTVTWDARIEKQVRLGRRRALAVSVEAYNLLNLRREVEERIVSGPGFGTPTVIQPPRAIGLSARYEF